MEERSWLWRKVGWWFVPVRRQTLRSLEWTKIRGIYRWESRRRGRRVMVLLWVVLLVVYAGMVLRVARGAAEVAFEMTVVWLPVVWMSFRAMRIRLAQPALEDRAVMEYGAEFDALTERQRGEIFNRQIRESFRGGVRADEREAELRLRAEGAAYRLLRPGLVVAVAVYWGVCLLGPFAAERGVLGVPAVVISWAAAGVLLLPVMVRMWTQPDEAGEPQIVAREV